MKNRFLLSKHHESWDEDALDAGETDEQWTTLDREPSDLGDVVRALRECSELSSSPVTPTACAHVWASTNLEQNYRTGEYESFSIHVRMANGSPVPHRVMWRILRLAGHTKG